MPWEPITGAKTGLTAMGQCAGKPKGEEAGPPGPVFNGSDLSGRKRALVIGINYTDYNNSLDSCVSDAKNMKAVLLQHYRFSEDTVLLLTDEETPEETLESPTRARILTALQWLVEGAQRNDSLVFYFSGHGLQTPDLNGDERDGLDEVICPVDYKTAGTIVDDDLHAILVGKLPEGCRLTVIMDCCHAGTMLDLPYEFGNTDLPAPPPSAPLGDVILLAG